MKTRMEYRMEHRRLHGLVAADAVEAQDAERGQVLVQERDERKAAIKSKFYYGLATRGGLVKDILDAVGGFFLPGIGDFLTSFLAFPAIMSAAFEVRSLPLTLAMIFNMLVDLLLGLVPVAGGIIDAFYLSNRKNARLLSGYVEGNKEIVRKVNHRASFMGIVIFFLVLLIYFTIKTLSKLVSPLFS